MYMESTIIADSHQKSWRPEGNRVTHLKYWKKKKKNQPRSLYLAKLSFTTVDETKTFLVKKKKKKHEFITTKSAPQEMLERVLQTEMKGH